MSKSPSGVNSDYRAERWAARVDYVSRHISDWLLMGFFCVVALFIAVCVVAMAINAWTVGAGWVTIVLVGIPLGIVGWNYLTKWSRRTLRQAARDRGELSSRHHLDYDDWKD